jgi:UDP-N-acetylmuramoyl-tripeptide--D-alanyl-D-alanine ligase
MRAVLKVLAAEKVSGRRIAVLGSMRELGPGSDDFHAGLAGPIEEACVEYAILVGEEMAALAKALGANVKMEHVPDVESALQLVRKEAGPGDAILVKGSNSVGLAALVEALASGGN